MGRRNDHRRFRGPGDLGLATVAAPTLLVHGTADPDVGPEHAERALGATTGAEILGVDRGTHLAVRTDPRSGDVRSAIAAHVH